jgi:hypothetical protein
MVFAPTGEITIEQALYLGPGPGHYHLLCRSAGFLDEWSSEAERLCDGFGERPAGVSCPQCVFANPFGKEHLAVVQVSDQGSEGTGVALELVFRLLVLPRAAYLRWIGDPFAVAQRFPANWHERGELPVLSWPQEPLPRRTVTEVQRLLKTSDGPTLLGGVQALVDGARLAFERSKPDPQLIRGLWTLLPASTRCHLWPATFAFDNVLNFHALVVPHAGGQNLAGYLTEEQAGDYPQGRYELNLQIAAEAGDQGELDSLFARRSMAQTWRLGIILVVVAVVLVLGMKLMIPAPRPQGPAPPAQQKPEGADKK